MYIVEYIENKKHKTLKCL